jgi:hypothetical protein
MPECAFVDLLCSDGSQWKVQVLLEAASKAPAIEATQANFNSLFRIVSFELEHSAERRAQYGKLTSVERRHPRGPREARQYWVRNRWITKMPVLKEPKSKRPGAKCHRTLKRRPTGDSAEGVVGASGRVKGRSRQSKPAGTGVSHNPDCLEAAVHDEI